MDAERKVEKVDVLNFLYGHNFDFYKEISSISGSKQENILRQMAVSFEPFLQQGLINPPEATGIHLLKNYDIEEQSSC